MLDLERGGLGVSYRLEKGTGASEDVGPQRTPLYDPRMLEKGTKH